MSSNINNTIKYVRGQVWYVKDNSPISKYDQDNSIEHGNRPYLIFSSNEGNAYSPIVSGIPITSKIKSKSVNYTYRDFKGDDYCILCNMLTPISKSCITRYMYTLSDEDMKEVEKRVLIAYGMYQYMHNFDMIYTFDQLNSVINGIVNSRVQELMQSKDYYRVSLEDMKNTVDKLVKDYRDDTRDSNSDKDDDSLVTCNQESVNIIVNSDNSKKTRSNSTMKRNSWTLDMCQQFLDDYSNLTKENLCKKYHISLKSICSRKHLCSVKLLQNKDSNEMTRQ